ncbi:MAG: ribosome small subunit-dependent GTPase A [Spirochaetota bacterium]
MSRTATVVSGRNNIFRVHYGERELLCRIKGNSLKLEERAYNPLAPGDEVVLESVDLEQGEAVIADRLPRRNEFARLNLKRDTPQTLGANIDLVVAVMSATLPAFRPAFVDRVLATASFFEIDAALVITKTDLDERGAEVWREEFATIGYPTVLLDAQSPQRLEALRALLSEKRSLLVGQSGVGKSTLLNRLAGREVQRVGSISDRYNRGTHTTNAGILHTIGSAELIDTPGIREIDCSLIPHDQLDLHYIEFYPTLTECMMRNCTHLHEPECAVMAAVARGAISSRRYDSYAKLHEDVRVSQEDRY